MLKFLTKKYIKYLAAQMKQQNQKRIALQTLPPGICIQSDIPYMQNQQDEHLLDVYFPENTEGRLPVLINIHGGGLFAGKKENNRNFNMHLAAYGYTVISLNYPLLPQTSFRRQLHDLTEALRFIEKEEQAERFHCNREQVNLIGDSAGAMLALYLSALQENREMRKAFRIPQFDLQMKSVGIISGFFYPQRMIRSLFCRSGNLRQKSYYPYLNMAYLIEKCRLAPLYLVTSEEDELREDTLRVETLLKKYDRPYHMKVWKKIRGKELTQRFSVQYPEWQESKETVEEMLNYMRQQEV